MPTYKVIFRPRAAKAFHKLSSSLKAQIARKLKQRVDNPKVEADRMRELPDGYRLKFRASGLRLVYIVEDAKLVVLVLSVGHRERDEVYADAFREFRKLEDG